MIIPARRSSWKVSGTKIPGTKNRPNAPGLTKKYHPPENCPEETTEQSFYDVPRRMIDITTAYPHGNVMKMYNLLYDIIDTIVLLELRKKLASSGRSTSEIFGKCQPFMCRKNAEGIVIVEPPNKQVKQYYSLFGTSVPADVDMSEFIKGVL